MGSLIITLLKISWRIRQWKNFKNPLTFDRVTAMSLLLPLSDTVYQWRRCKSREKWEIGPPLPYIPLNRSSPKCGWLRRPTRGRASLCCSEKRSDGMVSSPDKGSAAMAGIPSHFQLCCWRVRTHVSNVNGISTLLRAHLCVSTDDVFTGV